MKIDKIKNTIFKFWQEIYLTLFVATVIFLTGILIGLILPDFLKINIIKTISQKFAEILQGADSDLILGTKIFMNNLVVTLFLFILGAVLFISIPILLLNGAIIGIFLDLSWNMAAVQPGNFITTVLSLLPHGIFEIPAFLLAAVLGINLFLKIIFGKKILSNENRKQAFISYIKKYLIIIVPLLILAAGFEAMVSGKVMQSLEKKYNQKYLDNNLAIVLNNDFLIDNNCHLDNNLEIDESFFTSSLLQELPLLYDDDFLNIFSGFSKLNHWQDNYKCKQDYLKIINYDSRDYSALQAEADQKQILEKIGFTVSEENNIFSASNEDVIIFYKIFNFNNKTVIISWNGENKGVLENLEKYLD